VYPEITLAQYTRRFGLKYPLPRMASGDPKLKQLQSSQAAGGPMPERAWLGRK